MIKKLKLKFILINMAIVTIILSITFTAVYISTKQQLVQKSIEVLRRTLAEGDRNEPPKMEIGRKPGMDPGFNAIIPSFVVILDADGRIRNVKEFFYDLSDREALSNIVQACLVSEKGTGIIGGEDLRYMKEEIPYGLKIAFVTRDNEINQLSSLVKVSILVGLGSLAAFLVISLFLAGWALRPVEKAWDQQKQFVADASHELKTPLTVILANAGIVLSKKQDTVGSQAKWIEYIRTEAERMTTLVNNLLFLAKTDDAKARIILSRISFSDTVWSVILPFESVAFEQHKTLESDIAPDLFINGDEDKIRQLVGILLDNACKYSDDKGTISVKLHESTDHKLKLSVTNTGALIPQDQLHRIFERFYRVDKSRAREQGGYGLGLSIAQSIADMHGAKISVQSTRDMGTTFTVTFLRAC